VYNTDVVRQLCREITAEKDPHHVEELISLLRAVIRDDQEEIRTRMYFLAKKFADVISDSKAAD
jgi:cytochrome c-type biogenesis protein CcmH/NrfG